MTEDASLPEIAAAAAQLRANKAVIASCSTCGKVLVAERVRAREYVVRCPDGHVRATVDLDDDPLERYEYELALAKAARARLIPPSKLVARAETESTRAGDAPKRARTLQELWLYIEEHPCPKCGTPTSASALAESEYRVEGRIIETHAGSCRSCKTALRYEFEVPSRWPKPQPGMGLYGTAEPSQLFTAEEWCALAERRARDVAGDPSGLESPAFFVATTALHLAIDMLIQAKQLAPAAAIDARLAELSAQLARYAPLVDAMRARELAARAPVTPKPRLDKGSLAAHRAWVARGKTGGGRLAVEDQSVGGLPLGNLHVESARLVAVSFDRARVDFARFDGTELVECTAIATDFAHSVFDGASFDRCTFERARLILTDFKAARITGGSFAGANADRGAWHRVTIRGCDLSELAFGDCVLDGALFEDCDLRRADLSRKSSLDLCTTKGATFRRCDLRGATVAGRLLDDTRFVDCELRELGGEPAIVGAFTVSGSGADALQERWAGKRLG